MKKKKRDLLRQPEGNPVTGLVGWCMSIVRCVSYEEKDICLIGTQQLYTSSQLQPGRQKL